MDLIVKAYSIKPLRLTLKFTICLASVKIGFDFLYYLASGFSMAFPRYVHKSLIKDTTIIKWPESS